MNTNNVLRFDQISMAELSPDRTHCILHIDALNEQQVSLEIPLSEFSAIVSSLAQIAASASSPAPETAPIRAMPLSGLGIAASKNPDESLLMVQLPGLELAFSAPSDRMAYATDQLSQMAKTLTAKETQH